MKIEIIEELNQFKMILEPENEEEKNIMKKIKKQLQEEGTEWIVTWKELDDSTDFGISFILP